MFSCAFINLIPSAVAGPEIPGLIPEPREIRSLGGKAKLGKVVDLIISNVPPPQVKTIQEIHYILTFESFLLFYCFHIN